MKYIIAIVLVLIVALLGTMYISLMGANLVFFNLEGCPHCEDFEPVWNSLHTMQLTSSKGHVDLMKISDWLAGRFGVSEFPTLRYYPNGLFGNYIVYRGNLDIKSIVEFIRAQ